MIVDPEGFLGIILRNLSKAYECLYKSVQMQDLTIYIQPNDNLLIVMLELH